jgi:protein ImuB
VDWISGRAVIFDAAGLDRAIGPPDVIARELVRLAEAEAIEIRVALAASMTSAWLLAQAGPDRSVAASSPPGVPIAGLPIDCLETLAGLDSRPPAGPVGPGAAAKARDRRRVLAAVYAERCAILRRWGLRTLGDLARLDTADLRARLGPAGARLRQAARGEDARPLGPSAEPPVFVERVEFEWPIEGLEPLAFVLARPASALAAALERADRGAASVRSSFHLVTRDTHTRIVQLPAPIDDAAVLRTLVLLDLEAHPPPAAIDAVEIAVDPVPRRIVQHSLLDRAGASPEATATLLARLGALMGDTRVGRPMLLDTYDDRAVDMAPWLGGTLTAPVTEGEPRDLQGLAPVLRRFRLPVAARITVAHGAPVQVMPSARGLAGGDVVARAGPWRSSGRWWADDETIWDRDEWDLELTGGVVYHAARDRRTGQWVIEGVLD